MAITIIVKPNPPEMPRPPQPSDFGIGVGKFDERELEARNREYQRALEKYESEKSALQQRYQEQLINYDIESARAKQLEEQSKIAYEVGLGGSPYQLEQAQAKQVVAVEKRASELREQGFAPLQAKRQAMVDVFERVTPTTKKELTAEDIFAYPIQTEKWQGVVSAAPSTWQRYKQVVSEGGYIGPTLEFLGERAGEYTLKQAFKGGWGSRSFALAKGAKITTSVAPYFTPAVGLPLFVASSGEQLTRFAFGKSGKISQNIDYYTTQLEKQDFMKDVPVIPKDIATIGAIAPELFFVTTGTKALGVKALESDALARAESLAATKQTIKGIRIKETEAGGIELIEVKAFAPNYALEFPTGRLKARPTQFEGVATVPFIKVREGEKLLIEEARGLSAIKSGKDIKFTLSDITGEAEKVEGSVSRITKEAELSKVEKIKDLDISASKIKFKPIAEADLELWKTAQLPSGKVTQFARGKIRTGAIGETQRVKSISLSKEDEEGVIRFISGELPTKIKIPKADLGEFDVKLAEPMIKGFKELPLRIQKTFKKQGLGGVFYPSQGELKSEIYLKEELSSSLKEAAKKHELGHYYDKEIFKIEKKLSPAQKEYLSSLAETHLYKKYGGKIPYPQEERIGEFIAESFTGKTPITKIKVKPTSFKLKLEPSAAGIITRRKMPSDILTISKGSLTKLIKKSTPYLTPSIAEGLKQVGVKSITPAIKPTTKSPSLSAITKQMYAKAPTITQEPLIKEKQISSLYQLQIPSIKAITKQRTLTRQMPRQESQIRTLTRQMSRLEQMPRQDTRSLTRQLQQLKILQTTKQINKLINPPETDLTYRYGPPFPPKIPYPPKTPFPPIYFGLPSLKARGYKPLRLRKRGREDIAISPSFTGRVLGFKQIVRSIKDIERLEGRIGIRGEIVFARRRKKRK